MGLNPNPQPPGDCAPPCARGACLFGLGGRNDTACHCDDGFGGAGCGEPDVNECRFRPCSVFAECKNTVGSFECRCRDGNKIENILASVLALNTA